METTALIAEKLSASLQSNLILALQANASMINPNLIRPVSELLSLARELYGEALACSEREGLNYGTTRSLIGEICARGRNLSLREPQASAFGSAFEPLEKEFAGSENLTAAVPDPLGDADDDEVLQGIRAKGASFAANPSLDGRAPETGAFARCWARTDLSKGALAARFEARMIDIAECFAQLEAAEDGVSCVPGVLSIAARRLRRRGNLARSPLPLDKAFRRRSHRGPSDRRADGVEFPSDRAFHRGFARRYYGP